MVCVYESARDGRKEDGRTSCAGWYGIYGWQFSQDVGSDTGIRESTDRGEQKRPRTRTTTGEKTGWMAGRGRWEGLMEALMEGDRAGALR